MLRNHTGLSLREREVLACIGEGLSNQAIARQMTITNQSARRYVSSIYAKLGFIDDPDFCPRVCVARWVWQEKSHA